MNEVHLWPTCSFMQRRGAGSKPNMVATMTVEEVAEWLEEHGFDDAIQQAFKGDL